MRFCLTGVMFTILGPVLFWLAYPLGPLLALVLAELAVHTVRYHTFRTVVFPVDRGYRVSLRRYVVAALPVSLAGFVSVAVFRDRLDRNTLTLTTACIAVVVGFAWSRFAYARPAGKV
jgi:putative flippase GtrA